MKLRLVAVALALATALFAYCRCLAPRWLDVTSLRIGLPGLDANLRGLRIAHLSDFHVGGPGTSTGTLRAALDAAFDFESDLIAITGDFFDEGISTGDWSLFSRWPADVPVVTVLGNHDYRGGPAHIKELTECLKSAGVSVLANTAKAFGVLGETIWVAGVDDPHTRRDDLPATLQGIPPEAGPPLILLAHSPSIVSELDAGAARLVLAGHTHGGQVRLTPSGRIPFIGFVRRLKGLRPQPPLPLARGWHWWRGAVVLISDGLGLSKIPLRFRTRPQVILIELVDAPEDGPACDDVARYVAKVPRPISPRQA